MNLLESKNLCKTYRIGDAHDVRAIRDVSFSMKQGSWLTITGPSGSGKSTLLAILAALDRPSSGEVLFNGENLSSGNDVRLARYRKEKIGIVFQEYQLFEELSALENVCMPMIVSNLNDKSRKERAMSLLEHVGLANRARHLPRQLSGGERQRVALARALVRDPELLFADEPTSNIDKAAANMVMELFQTFKTQGKSLVVVSHSPDLAEAADTVLKMEDGGIVQ